MRARTFTIPFTQLGDFPELEWGPDDTLTVRPLFSHDAQTVAEFLERLSSTTLEDTAIAEKERDAESRRIVCDLLALCVVEWSLKDGDGHTIPIPKTSADLLALPAGLAGAFFGFFANYRGEGPNPTTGS